MRQRMRADRKVRRRVMLVESTRMAGPNAPSGGVHARGSAGWNAGGPQGVAACVGNMHIDAGPTRGGYARGSAVGGPQGVAAPAASVHKSCRTKRTARRAWAPRMERGRGSLPRRACRRRRMARKGAGCVPRCRRLCGWAGGAEPYLISDDGYEGLGEGGGSTRPPQGKGAARRCGSCTREQSCRPVA